MENATSSNTDDLESLSQTQHNASSIRTSKLRTTTCLLRPAFCMKALGALSPYIDLHGSICGWSSRIPPAPQHLEFGTLEFHQGPTHQLRAGINIARQDEIDVDFRIMSGDTTSTPCLRWRHKHVEITGSWTNAPRFLIDGAAVLRDHLHGNSFIEGKISPSRLFSSRFNPTGRLVCVASVLSRDGPRSSLCT